MSITTIDLALRIGPWWPDPAPAELMRALRQVEVTQQDSAPSGFQLTFLAEQTGTDPNFAIVRDELLRPFHRVLVRVSVDGTPTTLIDGFITHQQYMPSNGPEDSTFVVTGEDVSVIMDRVELSREFPSFMDAMTVEEILLPYGPLVGVVPEVVPAPSALVPFGTVPQQAGTDRCALQQLAQQNGYVFYVTPLDELFTSRAYWGPPERGDPPSAVLDVAVGAASTVDRAQAEYDALAATTYYGWAVQTYAPLYFPVAFTTFASTRTPALAADPALGGLSTIALDTRHGMWKGDDHDPVRAFVKAQAMTDASTDAVVTLSCDVSPVRLGSVVSAPGVVGVRGTGERYDGLYYLKSATHRIDLLSGEQWSYTQSLVMTREGVGTTAQTLEVS